MTPTHTFSLVEAISQSFFAFPFGQRTFYLRSVDLAAMAAKKQCCLCFKSGNITAVRRHLIFPSIESRACIFTNFMLYNAACKR